MIAPNTPTSAETIMPIVMAAASRSAAISTRRRSMPSTIAPANGASTAPGRAWAANTSARPNAPSPLCSASAATATKLSQSPTSETPAAVHRRPNPGLRRSSDVTPPR